jgi:hypothetical protein
MHYQIESTLSNGDKAGPLVYEGETPAHAMSTFQGALNKSMKSKGLNGVTIAETHVKQINAAGDEIAIRTPRKRGEGDAAEAAAPEAPAKAGSARK